MKSFLKKSAAALLALVMLVTLLMSAGCSTPRVAMTVGDEEFTTGQYLAYLYNSFYQIYVNQSLYYYDLYGGDSYDVWNEEYTYDEESKYDLAGLITRTAQDSIIRQVAVRQLMAKYNVTLSEDEMKEYNDYMATVPKDAYIEYGFNNDSFGKMHLEYNYNEPALLQALYAEGGQKGVTAEQLRTFFEENFFSYEIVSYSLVDSSNKKLSDDEIKKIDEKLNGYMAMYKETGDFNKVIDQKAKDDKAEAAASTTTTTGTGTTAAATTTTAAATTTTTDADTTTTATTTTTASGTGTGSTTTTEDKPSTLEDNRMDVVAKDSDKEFIDALKAMAFDEAKIIEYKTDDEIPMKALVLRLDPEANRGKDKDGKEIDYYVDQHDSIVYYMSFDKLDEEINAQVKTLTVTKNDRAIKACDPYAFRSSIAG